MTSGGKGVAVVLLIVVPACASRCSSPAAPGARSAPPAPSERADLPALAESYVRLALQFAEHNPALVESWRGSSDWEPGPREPVEILLRRLEGLERDLARQSAEAGSNDRAAYLSAQAQALHLVGDRLLGRSEPFGTEARRAFGVTPVPSDPESLEKARAGLQRELPGKGTLVDRYAAYKRQFVVPRKHLERVMHRALDACRAATATHIDLPGDERIELTLSPNAAWDAYTRYAGRHVTRLELNRDAELDITRALRVACHEGYPGHHVQNIWIDDELVQGRHWQEFNLSPTFGRHLLITEGAAEVGVDLVFPDEARIAVYRDVLFPAAGLKGADASRLVRIEALVMALEPVIGDVIGAYLDNDITQARALERLRDDALTLDPETLLFFAEHYRTRALAYPVGHALVQRLVGDRGLAGLRRVFVDQPFAVQ
jgi:hypothetical protein